MMTLLYITLFAGLIPVIELWILRINAEKTGPFGPFLYLTAISSLYELIFTLYLKIDVKIWFTVYDITEFLLIFYFFFKINAPKYRILFLITMALFAVLIIPNVLIINKSIHHFFDVQAVFSGAITAFIFMMTFLWLTDIFRKIEIPGLWDKPEFYYISALFIYHACTFFLFLLIDALLKNGDGKFMDYWVLNVFATLILRILLMIGVWKTSRK